MTTRNSQGYKKHTIQSATRTAVREALDGLRYPEDGERYPALRPHVVAKRARVSLATARRHLEALVTEGVAEREGRNRFRYRLLGPTP